MAIKTFPLHLRTCNFRHLCIDVGEVVLNKNQISDIYDVKIIQVHSNIQLEINYYLDLPSLPSLHPSHLGRLSRGAPWGPWPRVIQGLLGSLQAPLGPADCRPAGMSGW